MKPKPTIMLMMLIGLLAVGGRCYACITTPTADFKEAVIDTMTGAKVTFDARESFDPGGYIVKFEFDFDYEEGVGFVPGHTECLEDCGGARDHYFDGIVTHAFDKLDPAAAQDYEVAVRVTDNASPPNTDIATCTVHVHKGVNLDETSDYTSIQDAIDAYETSCGTECWADTEIWVAPGWYQENVVFGSGDGIDGIILRSTNPGDPEVVGKTVIAAGNEDDQVVVFGSEITEATKLQGFTVEGPGGWGTPSSPGRGIYCNGGSPVIENCVIRGHYIGVYNDASAYPVISNCVVYNNGEGAGMVNDGASVAEPVKVRNCIFTGNTNNRGLLPLPCGYCGGGIHNANTKLELTNCTIYGNESAPDNGGLGGGVHHHGNGSVTMKNCIVWGNIANFYHDIDNWAGVEEVVTVDYSVVNEDEDYCFDDVTFGEHNINADPEFAAEGDPAGPDGIFGTLDDGLRIRPGSGSPCIDKGNPGTTTVEVGDVDLWGNARFRDGDYGAGSVVIDMGACEAASVWFVDDDEVGNDDGKSWANAFEYLQDALDDARDGDEVWVSGGTYYPDEDKDSGHSNDDPTESFSLVAGAEVYGGFPTWSGDPSWADRDWLGNTTTLSGDIDSIGDDDSYHVVKGADDAVIDGFVISGGRADGVVDDDRGGGMYNENCEPVVRNCVFSGNIADRGGGVFNHSASPKFERCVFVENTADVRGGGMFNYGATSNPEVVNCVFQGNSSVGGGGIYNASRGSHPTITNCTLTGNDAYYDEMEQRLPHGGGMFNFAASPTVTNCIFWDNTCQNEEASNEVYNYEAAANPSFRHCDIENCLDESENWVENLGTDSGENMDAPPEFDDDEVNPEGADGVWMTVDDGLQLTLDVDYLNPCVDAGDDEAAPERDIVGIRRRDISWISGTLSDIGAYEFSPASVPAEKATMVVMLWIDESSPYYSESYDSSKWILFNLTDLPYYNSVVANAGVRAIRSGCRVPPTNEGYPYQQEISDVLPYGYVYNPESPPAGITISKSGRPPSLYEIIEDFDEIRDGAEPDYLVLIVDNSGSMDPWDIDPAYTQFRTWVQEQEQHPHVIISPDEWPYHTILAEEDWVRTMADKITYFLNNL